MLISELRDKCVSPWEPVFIDINEYLYPIIAIHDNTVYVGNAQEPMFAQEILDELEGKHGKLDIVK